MNRQDLHAGYDQGGDSGREKVEKSHDSCNKSEDKAPIEVGHCHNSIGAHTVDLKARKKLLVASILCLFFMIGEIIGGAMARSLAIMTDAAHLLTDFASFLISLLSLYLAVRPSTKKMSFGWYRAEVLGAVSSVLMIWLVTGILVYMAVLRIMQKDYQIDGKIMLATSTIGVLVNIVMVLVLHDHGHSHKGSASAKNEHIDAESGHQSAHNHSHQNITVRAALIHVIGDLLQSVGVMIAAMIIYFNPSYKIVDPICTFIFSILVLITTVNILRDAMNVLMEATPRGLEFNQVKNALNDIEGVVEVHNLRMWSLTMNKTAASVHLCIGENIEAQSVLGIASNLLRSTYAIQEVTIQIEQRNSKMADCRDCNNSKH